MQKLLQQLPATAAHLVKSQQAGAGQEEAKSPVLVPDGSVQTWYSTLEGDESRLLKVPDQEAATYQSENSSSTDASVAQPLR